MLQGDEQWDRNLAPRVGAGRSCTPVGVFSGQICSCAGAYPWGGLLFRFVGDAGRAAAPENLGSSPERVNSCQLFVISAHMRRPVNAIFRAQTRWEGVGNHANSRAGCTVPYLCAAVGSCLHRLNSSVPYGLCARVAAGHRPAAPGEWLLGSGACLFLLQSPNHLLHSGVLDGVLRPIPPLSLRVANGDLIFSVPFLSFYPKWSCCDGHVRVHGWLSGLLPCQIPGLLKE